MYYSIPVRHNLCFCCIVNVSYCIELLRNLQFQMSYYNLAKKCPLSKNYFLCAEHFIEKKKIPETIFASICFVLSTRSSCCVQFSCMFWVFVYVKSHGGCMFVQYCGFQFNLQGQ